MNICPNMYICLLTCIYMCMLIVFIHESHVVFVYVLLLDSLFVCLLFFVCSPIMEEIKYFISYLILACDVSVCRFAISIEAYDAPVI